MRIGKQEAAIIAAFFSGRALSIPWGRAGALVPVVRSAASRGKADRHTAASLLNWRHIRCRCGRCDCQGSAPPSSCH